MPKNLKSGVALAVLACIASPSISFAQEGATIIEEIVVTATKRTQTLQETPVAVSVVTAEAIEEAQILDISDLQSVVPSLRITQLQNSTNTNFVIRGFGNGANNPGIEPSVGVFVDNVYRSRSAGAIGDLPSLERVEVLNGPQSTLFGKNASAGVVSVVTAKPSGEYGGKVSLSLGNRDSVVLKGEVEDYISDTAAFKISAGLNRKDGYAENLVTGNDINNRNRFNVRGDLLLNPNDDVEIRIIADYDNIDEECCASVNLFSGPTLGAIQGAGGDIISNDPEATSILSNIDPTNQQDNYGISAQIDWDLGNIAITSITSYREIDTFANIDADFTSADLITNDIQTDIETFTQEYRITDTGNDNFDWQVGVFYFNEDITTVNNLPFGENFRDFVDVAAGAGGAALIAGLDATLQNGLFGPATSSAFTDEFLANLDAAELAALNSTGTTEPFFSSDGGVSEIGTLDNESISLFGQFDYHINDRLTASLGLNYTYDEKDATLVQTSNDIFSSLDLNSPILSQQFLPNALTPAVTAGLEDAINALTGGTLTQAQLDAQVAAELPGALATAVADTIEDLGPIQFLPATPNLLSSEGDSSTDDDELTYSLRLAYDVSDSLNAYVSYSTGFKASSFNLTRDTELDFRFADPEEAEVFEIGLKGRFSRGSFNLALFDQSLENFQSNTFIGTGFALTNAGEQSVLGAEFDITYYPTDALELKFATTLLDPEFDSFLNGPAVELNPGDPESTDLSGQTPAGIHEVSFSLAATYKFNIGNNDAFIRGDFYFEDEVQVTDNVPGGTVTFADGTVADINGVRETENLNVAAGITTPSGFNFSIWARNLTDHDTLISSFPGIAQFGTFNGYRNEPRTYGVTVSKDF